MEQVNNINVYKFKEDAYHSNYLGKLSFYIQNGNNYVHFSLRTHGFSSNDRSSAVGKPTPEFLIFLLGLNMQCLYLDTLIIGQKFCSIVSGFPLWQ